MRRSASFLDFLLAVVVAPLVGFGVMVAGFGLDLSSGAAVVAGVVAAPAAAWAFGVLRRLRPGPIALLAFLALAVAVAVLAGLIYLLIDIVAEKDVG